jgi:hypothetical protein
VGVQQPNRKLYSTLLIKVYGNLEIFIITIEKKLGEIWKYSA